MRLRPAFLGVALKRMLRMQRVEVSTAYGTFWVDPGSNIGQRVYQYGAYDTAAVEVLKQTLKPGDTYLDIGANEGHLCVVAGAQVGPAGRVIAVEPQTRLHPVLRRNLELNAMRADILSLAVSDKEGEAELHLAPDTNNASSGLSAQTRYPVPVESVQTVTLARLLDQCGCIPHVVKMDIEGFEHEAILGSPQLFREKRIPLLLLELHEGAIAQRGLDPLAVPRFLNACGYCQRPQSGGQLWEPIQTAL